MPTQESQTNARRFVAGSISGKSGFPSVPALLVLINHLLGITSVFFTYPLELIRVRMAYNTHSESAKGTNAHSPHTAAPHRASFVTAVRQIYHEGASSQQRATAPPSASVFNRLPMVKFYRGFTVTLAGIIPYAGTSFLTWGYLKSYFIPPFDPGNPHASRRPGAVADLACGAVAGALSQTVSYPFEVVRRRMQVGGLTHPERWMRWDETVRTIWVTRGWKGFFVGLSIGYLKIVPMTAVSYTVWQWGKHVLGV